jgi:hypothetical protein
MTKEFNISDTGKSEVIETNPTPTPKVPTTEAPVIEVKLSEEKKKLKFKNLIFPIVAFLCLAGIGGFYYFGIYKVKSQPLNKVLSFNQDFIPSVALSNIFKNGLSLLSAPQEPKTEVSPINGMLFTKTQMDIMKTRRPVAVMTNNHADARPLSGTNSADVVIEANAEGGITRLMAIYWGTAPEKVGPIRSIRQYYLEWASEYDPLIIHDGCASSDDPRTNACGNLYNYGVKDISTIGAWRWNDGRRVAPHNEYSSITYAWEYAKKLDWDSFPSSFKTWKFKTDAEISQRGEKTQVELTFHQRLLNSGLYNVIWTYDQSTNTYLRKVGGQADIDQETNTQVYAKDVIVQEVSMVQSGDDKGHLIITTIGQGDASYLMDGKITHGTWKKTSRTDRTTYYDSNGKEMEFNRGRIWVEMIGTSDGKFDIIEQ